MQIAFSTLACPEWSFEQILTAAKQFGYDCIEWRGVGRVLEMPDVPEFSPAQVARTREQLQAAGLCSTCLASSVRAVAATATEVDRHTAVAQGERYIDLAKELEAPFVRVFCGAVPPTMLRGEAVDRASALLRHLGDFAVQRQVTVLVETHDAFVRSEEVEELIRQVNHPAVQVLWDVHHPYRMAGETVDHTLHYLGRHVRAVHVKDSVLDEDGEHVTYVMLGQGDVPVHEALRALKAQGYDGVITVEWEKRWHPALASPDIALPQYAQQLRAWLATL